MSKDAMENEVWSMEYGRSRTASGLIRRLRFAFVFSILLTSCFVLLGAYAPMAHAAFTMPQNNLGLVGWWTMDSYIGASTVVDSSGFGSNGTLVNNPPKVAGKINQALSFNGSTQYMTATPPSVSGTFTVALWLYKRDNGNTEYILSSRAPYEHGFAIGYSGSDLTFLIGDGTNFYSGPNVAVSQAWHHIVAVVTTTGCTVYVDGAQAGATTFSANPLLFDTNHHLYLGSLNGSVQWASGYIDDLRVYNRALSASEVKTLYDTSLGSHMNESVNPPNLQNGLVGWWTMDGPNLHNNVTDSSGQGNNGALITGGAATSTMVTPGVLGQALSFNGTNQYVRAGTGASFNSLFSKGVSMCAWAKYPNFTAFQRTVTLEDSGDEYSDVWIQTVPTSGTIQFGVGEPGNYKTGTTSLLVNTWYFLCGVSDYTSGGTKIYINAKDDGGTVTGTPNYIANKGHLDIGALEYSGLYYGHATIDDVRIYNRALSAAEVQQLYNLGTATHQNVTITPPNLNTGLVGHWTFDGHDMLQNVKDTSGQGNNGVLITGGAATSTMVTQGVLGQALKFNGSSQYVTVSNPSNFSFSNGTTDTPFSLSYWVYLTSTANPVSPLLKWNGVNSKEEYVTLINSGGTLTVEIDDLSTGGYYGITSSQVIKTRQWYHVAVVYNGNASTQGVNSLALYINGTSASVSGYGAAQYRAMQPSTQPLVFGYYVAHGGTGYFFPGSVDDVRIYNRALSATEIKQLYNLGH